MWASPRAVEERGVYHCLRDEGRKLWGSLCANSIAAVLYKQFQLQWIKLHKHDLYQESARYLVLAGSDRLSIKAAGISIVWPSLVVAIFWTSTQGSKPFSQDTIQTILLSALCGHCRVLSQVTVDVFYIIVLIMYLWYFQTLMFICVYLLYPALRQFTGRTDYNSNKYQYKYNYMNYIGIDISQSKLEIKSLISSHQHQFTQHLAAIL